MTPKERLEKILSKRKNIPRKVERITPKSEFLKELERLSSQEKPSQDNVIAIKQRELLLNAGMNSNHCRGQAQVNPEWHLIPKSEFLKSLENLPKGYSLVKNTEGMITEPNWQHMINVYTNADRK